MTSSNAPGSGTSERYVSTVEDAVHGTAVRKLNKKSNLTACDDEELLPMEVQQQLGFARQQLEAERSKTKSLEEQVLNSAAQIREMRDQLSQMLQENVQMRLQWGDDAQRNAAQLQALQQRLTQAMQENVRLRVHAVAGSAALAKVSGSRSPRNANEHPPRLPQGDSGQPQATTDGSMAAPPGPPRHMCGSACAYEEEVLNRSADAAAGAPRAAPFLRLVGDEDRGKPTSDDVSLPRSLIAPRRTREADQANATPQPIPCAGYAANVGEPANVGWIAPRHCVTSKDTASTVTPNPQRRQPTG
eukprot:TRINITY_DN61133_c0_g1_i1.p1 TRINITY_DN61133_c0_g1~~TRINITY_DN61133_c0_g1_i1.p1  ORF type:complete len:302 (-),score=66.51 TRINITY_DN61133_c0_g1_i1:229-1134(-)